MNHGGLVNPCSQEPTDRRTAPARYSPTLPEVSPEVASRNPRLERLGLLTPTRGPCRSC